MEIAVLGLIGWEISLSYSGEKLQADNFATEKKLLTDLSTNTSTTATNLATLQTTTDLMKQSAEKQLEATKAIVAASTKSAKAAEASSKTAVEALHISERPYLNVDATLSTPLKAGEKLKFTAIVTNTGKSTAMDMVCMMRSSVAPSQMSLETIHEQAFSAPVSGRLSQGSLAANGGHAETIWESSIPVTDDVISSIKNKDITIYVFGQVVYSDLVGPVHQHHTHICAYYDPDRNGLMLCESFQKID